MNIKEDHSSIVQSQETQNVHVQILRHLRGNVGNVGMGIVAQRTLQDVLAPSAQIENVGNEDSRKIPMSL